MRQGTVIVQLCVACVALWTLYIVTRPGSRLSDPVIPEGDAHITELLDGIAHGADSEEAAMDCSFSGADEGEPLPLKAGEPDGIAILFNVVRNLETPIIWSRWAMDAASFIKDAALEDSLVNPSQVLRFYIHYSPFFSPEAVQEMLPSVFNSSLIGSPVLCAPSNINPCLHRLMEFSTLDYANAGYFFVLDQTSIPLKPFRHIYHDVQKDQRIRATFKSFCSRDQIKPHSAGAVGYPRNAVEALVKNTTWVDALWEATEDHQSDCAPDECAPWTLLEERYDSGLAPYIVYPQSTESPPNSPHKGLATLDAPCNGLTERWLRNCTSVKRDWLTRQLESSNIWFGRGFSDHTQIEDDGLELDAFLAETWNSTQIENVGMEHAHQRDELQFLTSLKNATLEIMHQALQKEQPWGIAI